MKTSVLQAILVTIGLISLASLGAILLFINPPPAGEGGSLLVPILFSLSLFLLLVSTLTFLGVWARKHFMTEDNRQEIFTIALREAFLLSALGAFYLWLAHFGVFKIWIAALTFVIMLAVEYYFLTHSRYARA